MIFWIFDYLAPGDCIIYPSLVIYPNKCQQKKFVIFKFFLWVIPLINFLNNGFNIGAIYLYILNMWCYLRGFSCGRVNCRPRRNVCCTIHRRAACHLCPLVGHQSISQISTTSITIYRERDDMKTKTKTKKEIKFKKLSYNHTKLGFLSSIHSFSSTHEEKQVLLIYK